MPTQHGGATVSGNLAVACPACNFRKGTNLSAVDEAGGEVVSLFHPRRDRWSDHFVMRGGRIEPQTAKGRATAKLLEFNSAERVAAREFERSIEKNR